MIFTTNFLKKCLIGTFLLVNACGFCAFGAIYNLPDNGDTLIGQTTVARVQNGDTVSTIARRYDLGFYELLDANPSIEPTKLKTSHKLVIASRFILPNGVPHQGIVVNLAELRLYYFIPNTQQVFTAPVGIGRQNWDTPLGTLSVIQKKTNPSWHPTPAVREDVERRTGVVLPAMMPAGPDNPLGAHMLRLSDPTYLIHGTNDPNGVGRRVSAGCLRMYPEDIKALYDLVSIGTPVTIINQPYKTGIANNKLYFEAHQPLVEMRTSYTDTLDPLWNTSIQNALTAANYAPVNWERVKDIARAHEGIPVAIAFSSPSIGATPTAAVPETTAATPSAPTSLALAANGT